jgi:hypothetical protein
LSRCSSTALGSALTGIAPSGLYIRVNRTRNCGGGQDFADVDLSSLVPGE